MDNDDYRRGRLSCHKVYGEAQAILAGDALLTKAFELASIGAIARSEQDPTKAHCGAYIIRAIAQAAGSEGMVGGQVIDLEGETRTLDEAEHRTLCNLKTGALLTVPVIVSVLCADKMHTQEGDLLIQYASALGLAFQIKDDILDVEGDAQLLGKATGMDAKSNKTTFVSLYGIDGAKKQLDELTKQALTVCTKLEALNPMRTEQCAFLRDLAVFLLERNY